MGRIKRAAPGYYGGVTTALLSRCGSSCWHAPVFFTCPSASNEDILLTMCTMLIQRGRLGVQVSSRL